MITKIQIDNSFLVNEADGSSLSAAAVAAASTLTVVSISKFGVNQILLIGELGSEKSEIIKTHASTAPTGSTVTLASNLVYAHEAGTSVYIIDYDRYELSNSPTTTGSKTLLTTTIGSGLIAIDVEKRETLYNDTEYSSGYYFVRRKETIGNTFSGYSDPIPQSGFGSNTVGYIVNSALRELSLSLSEKVSMEDCYRWINKGLREIKGKVRRWPEHFVYNYVAGQVSRGTNVVTMPTNIYDSETNLSIEAIRIGDGKALTYLDPGSFDTQQGEVNVTQVTTQALAADTTLAIDNSYDFDDSGTVTVYISGTKYDITYTGVTRSATAGVLTGIPASGTGSITVTIPVDTYVWQHEEEGEVGVYTVRNGAIEFWPLVTADKDNQNVYMDYNTEVTEVNSEADEIDYQRFDMLEAYLTWRMWCKSDNDGMLDMKNGYYGTYKECLNDAIRIMPTHKSSTGPNVNRMMRRGGRNGRPDIIPEYG